MKLNHLGQTSSSPPVFNEFWEYFPQAPVQWDMKRFLFALLFVTLLGSSLPVFGLGLIVVPDHDTWVESPPRFRMPHPPRPWAPLELNFANVHAQISDQIATTTVEQEFYNPNGARLEGTFLFPVPKGAHLDKFTMEIDGKPVDADSGPSPS